MMSKVFVWKSLGCTDVYAVDTEEQLQKVLLQVSQVVKGIHSDETEQEIKELLDSNLGTKRKIGLLIGIHGDDQEDFEHGTGFYEVIA